MTTLIPIDDSEGCVGQSDAEAALEQLFSLADPEAG
jgi:hypothetical protein